MGDGQGWAGRGARGLGGFLAFSNIGEFGSEFSDVAFELLEAAFGLFGLEVAELGDVFLLGRLHVLGLFLGPFQQL